MSLTRVALVIPQSPAFFELGVVHEVFGVDRTDDGVPAIEFRACSERPGEPVSMSNGMSLTTSHGLEDAEDADLVVAAAYDYDVPPSEAVLEVFRRAHARGAWVLSVCSGAFLLGEAGLLDGRACTTHWRHTADLERRFPLAVVDPDVLFVEDDRVITSAGTAAGIDACLHHVRCELGAAVANRIARRMVVPPQRDGGQRQYIDLPVPDCSADSLTPLLVWMREHLAEELPGAHPGPSRGDVGAHLRAPVRRRDRHHARQVAARPAAAPRAHPAREQRPARGDGRLPRRLRLLRPAAPPLRRPRRGGPGGVPPHLPYAGRRRRLSG